jgi:hypothetical protein
MATKWLIRGGVIGAVVLRVILALSGATSILRHRVEVVTPVNSFKRLAEGRWLLKDGLSPYEGEQNFWVQLSPFLLLLCLKTDRRLHHFKSSLRRSDMGLVCCNHF